MTSVVKLGELTIGEEIGRGGFGRVYEAAGPRGEKYAVKVLDPQGQPDAADFEVRFEREIQTMMGLSHRYIIRVYWHGQVYGKSCFVMEYFSGLSLYDARRRYTPSPEAAARVIDRAVKALAYAHTEGVVHRDLKPRNIMVRTGGHLRVLDFGVAAALDPDRTRLTRAGAHPVGDAYTSPERLADPGLLDPRCDVYGIGACWFWLLTKMTPNARNPESVLRGVDGVSAQYADVLMKTMAPADERFDTMEALSSAIASLLEPAEGPPPSYRLLDEAGAVALGLVFDESAEHDSVATFYRLEQRAVPVLSRFRLRAAISELEERGFIEAATTSGRYEDPQPGWRVAEGGTSWILGHKDHLDSLLKAHGGSMEAIGQEKSEPGGGEFGDDIPF